MTEIIQQYPLTFIFAAMCIFVLFMWSIDAIEYAFKPRVKRDPEFNVLILITETGAKYPIPVNPDESLGIAARRMGRCNEHVATIVDTCGTVYYSKDAA